MDSHSRKSSLACRYDVFSAVERMEYKRIYEGLRKRRVGIAELETGYQFQYEGDTETLRLINNWISLERKCCSFLTFTVIARNEEEPLFLEVTGEGEIKSFLENAQEAVQSNITFSNPE